MAAIWIYRNHQWTKHADRKAYKRRLDEAPSVVCNGCMRDDLPIKVINGRSICSNCNTKSQMCRTCKRLLPLYYFADNTTGSRTYWSEVNDAFWGDFFPHRAAQCGDCRENSERRHLESTCRDQLSRSTGLLKNDVPHELIAFKAALVKTKRAIKEVKKQQT